MNAAILSTVVACVIATPARADQFSLDNGVEGRWSLGVSIGTNVRAGEPDAALIMPGNLTPAQQAAAGTNVGNSAHDDGNLNFKHNRPFSTLLKVVGEVEVTKDHYGAFLRAKAWKDFLLSNKSVPFGSYANGYAPNQPLNDGNFDKLSKFNGVALADAYVFGKFDLAEDQQLKVTLGNHVVNWGESLFVPGVNQFGKIDVNAYHQAGVPIKEVLLPVPQLSANLGLGKGFSLDAFYQFRWRRSMPDGCGTYWSLTDVLNCSDGGNLANPALPDAAAYAGVPAAALGLPPAFGTVNFRMSQLADKTPANNGMFGLSGHYYSTELGTDFGAYFVNYSAHFPNVSLIRTPTTVPGSFYGSPLLPGFNMSYLWDYGANNIKVTGLSASGLVAGWSVAGELSYTRDFPVQINGVDFVQGAFGIGPLAGLATTAAGSYMQGYDRKDKLQLNLSTIKIFPKVAGAESLTLVAEAAGQRWSALGGNYLTDRRYGRAFVYGMAQTSTLSCAATGNANPLYCAGEGFFTPNAWGLRAAFELSYPSLFAGINVKPKFFISRDVSGYSADSQFIKGRTTASLSARAEYINKYYLDIAYTRFNHNAAYDVFHDRDYYSAVVGANF